LLVENSSLINEIDSAQDKIDAQTTELDLLRTELTEIKSISAAKTEEFKEILTEKNFAITNSEGENAGLKQEINQLKSEIFELNSKFESYNSENTDLYNQISESHSNISQLNTQFEELNNKVYNYEIEIESLKQNQVSNQNEEQSIIIEDLYKKVEDLLEEKNLMAEQLLKMNSVVGEISQEVDNQNIDVMSLSNHRKNVILANNSEENNEKTLLKKQINDLVREIDKCIMLLSA
jgi:chromosome segregation ATPase